MEDRKFDALARTLATGVTRRQALKAALATAAGGALFRSGLGTAEAAPTPQQIATCLKYCVHNFRGAALESCVIQAIHGKGACFQCGGPEFSGGGGSCDTGFNTCGTNTNCNCFTTIEGGGVCGCNTYCSKATSCTASSDCPTGYVCITSNGCTGCDTTTGVCIAACSGAHAT
ncbi:MAG: hypothetical protein ACRDFX_12915, partial [Chloroflexota bacterium]